MHSYLIKLISAAVFLGGTATAHAQIEKNQGTGFVGLLAGYADPTNVDGRFGYGAQGGMVFPNGITGLIYLMNSTADENGADYTLLHYGLGLDYSLSGMFSGPLGGMHAGVRLGMLNSEAEASGVSVDDEAFTYGVALGYDHKMTEAFSLGGEASLIVSSDDKLSNTLYLLVSGKYWF